MTEYRLITLWRIKAPVQPVFDAIFDSLRWPDWWPGADHVEERAPGDTDGVGSVRRYTWKGRLPYRVCFDARTTRIERMRVLEASVSGDLEGIGRWTFSDGGEVTTVRYEWHVRTTRRWMNLLAPIARPVFSRNHHLLMRQGAEGLADLLNSRLVDAISTESPQR
jgi:Polyketide cyclase / dehydrase and lipid transport